MILESQRRMGSVNQKEKNPNAYSNVSVYKIQKDHDIDTSEV
jgi:hypothetical protein